MSLVTASSADGGMIILPPVFTSSLTLLPVEKRCKSDFFIDSLAWKFDETNFKLLTRRKLFSKTFLYSDIFGDISRHQKIGVVNEVGPSLLPERTNLA